MSTAAAELRSQRFVAAVPDLERIEAMPLLAEIDALKRARNAVVLAHNYQAPAIYHGVADFTGDSLALAQQAARSEADVIVVAGVQFMAETAKLLNPTRLVLISSLAAGCSLAESISAADVRALRRRHPGVPVVSYVNTSAAVKAESDICCTSANALRIVESLGVPKVIFLPDRYLGHHVQQQTGIELVLWEGACEVHERFTGAQLRGLRRDHPGLQIVAHPECPPEVLAEADFVGSTQGMVDHLARSKPAQVVLITECSMSDNVAGEFPEIRFVRPCNLCPHMRQITLAGIRDALRDLRHEVTLPAEIIAPARRALERMLAVGRA
ncbi:quinolinate synthase NadA [Metallibacterium sp.]|uniref:quinolinate synthase NadA n=1 Tax=Metallibacterium sp. TaxID=2940281 RepID=UPI0026327621|nr:quinolinate synthase NadA [Metallibacterium sp.]